MGKREPASAFLGRRYGKLVITEVLPNTINGRTHVIATCDCGETWTGRVNSLKSGNTKSCGCDSLTFEDFTGLRFNRWTALECVQRSSAMQQTLWKCRCDCGRGYRAVHQRINISHWDPIRALMTPTNKPNGAC